MLYVSGLKMELAPMQSFFQDLKFQYHLPVSHLYLIRRCFHGFLIHGLSWGWGKKCDRSACAIFKPTGELYISARLDRIRFWAFRIGAICFIGTITISFDNKVILLILSIAGNEKIFVIRMKSTSVYRVWLWLFFAGAWQLFQRRKSSFMERNVDLVNNFPVFLYSRIYTPFWFPCKFNAETAYPCTSDVEWWLYTKSAHPKTRIWFINGLEEVKVLYWYLLFSKELESLFFHKGRVSEHVTNTEHSVQNLSK